LNPASEIIPQVRVLIADDSTVMRTALVRMLESSPIIRVCGTARNGVEAVEKTKLLQPDVVTMDVHMPVLDGIQALKQIMREAPCPVLMVSSLTLDGAQITLEALEAGAFDYLPKEDLCHEAAALQLRYQLVEKIEAAARSPLALGKKPFRSTFIACLESDIASSHVAPRALVLGTSTGGPKALQDILPELPGDLPVGLLVVQHMPPGFTAAFAKRLDGLCRLSVREARHGDLFEPRTVYIAPAGQHMTIFNNRSHQVQICLSDFPANTTHRPSVDVTMLSVAELFGEYALGIILTGMGCDGVEGMTAIRDAGGITIGQDEATCAVYGMPRVCASRGVLQKVVALDQIPAHILGALKYRAAH
jgi:two-component system, chemotaxis family, protein-glutamate methylesterase/glutaminase